MMLSPEQLLPIHTNSIRECALDKDKLLMDRLEEIHPMPSNMKNLTEFLAAKNHSEN